ncbi:MULTISPECIES: hypothetical protein [Methanosarcina]|uniref:hypothetical protein n=1 Tax=Methanosarcina TaxID=2207 RepID=UPI000A54D2B0|nr:MULTISPECIES: hypothetical protein [Methanosarcina]
MFRNEDTKFKFAALKHDPIFIEWIDTTNPKKQLNTYVRALEIYTEYTGIPGVINYISR